MFSTIAVRAEWYSSYCAKTGWRSHTEGMAQMENDAIVIAGEVD